HTFKSELSRWTAGVRGIQSIVDVLLRIGLAIGLLTLGIAGLRAVVDRRRAIGVLRALGLSQGGVVGGLVVEAILTAAIGIAVGVTAGMLLAYVLLSSLPNGGFKVD